MKTKNNFVLKRNFASIFAKCKEYEQTLSKDNEELLTKILYADVSELSIEDILKVFDHISELSPHVQAVDSYTDGLVKRLMAAPHSAQKRRIL